MTSVEVVTGKDMVRKQTQLTCGPAALTVQTRFGQASFLGADLGDRLSAGLNFIRDRIEKGGTICTAAVAI